MSSYYIGKKKVLSQLLLGASLLGSLAGTASHAQQMPEKTAPEAQGGIGDIIVTAQKREESLQDIPVAVTALTRDVIEQQQIQGFNDIAALAPNVSTVQSVAGSSPTITIRGIIGSSIELSKDSGVALYIDGVYIARSTGAGFDVADLERVEVLRGPQGTLYGRNATGGAVNYITAAPKGEARLRHEVTVGNLDRLRTKTLVDLPKFGDFSVSFAFLHDEQDGWVRNSAAGRVYDFSQISQGRMGMRRSVDNFGGKNVEAGRVAVRYQPETIPLTVDYKFDMADTLYINRAQEIILDQGGFAGLRTNPPTLKAADAAPMGFNTGDKLKASGHSLTVAYDIADNLHFQSVSGLRKFKDEYSQDVAGGGLEDIAGPGNTFTILGIVNATKETTFSQEFQLTYDSEILDIIGGLFYFRQNTSVGGDTAFFATLPQAENGPVPVTPGRHLGRAWNRSHAAYAQATLHPTDTIDITGGLRYTKDKRAIQEATSSSRIESDFNNVDWTVNLTYRPTQDITAYAKVGSGYISGGVAEVTGVGAVAFDPEKLIQYEVGLKADLFDRRLRLNLASFYSDYKDLQTSIVDRDTGVFVPGNAGKATIKGIEVEATAVPIDGLTLNANYGFSDFKYKTFLNAGTELAGIASPVYRPKHTLNLAANLEFPEFNNGIKPSVNVNARWHSDMALYLLPATYDFGQTFAGAPGALPNYNPADLATIDKFTQNNSVWDLDARATLAEIPLSAAKLKASVWVRNLLDKRTITNATSLAFFGVVTGQFKEPRTYGLDIGIEF